jgi:hypothetical protein
VSANEIPRPPYVLLFEEVVPGARPLTILVDDRGAVPLFDSETKARGFLASVDLGVAEPVEVSSAGLIRALESVADEVGYVALDPPPAREEGGMRVRMGSLRELVDALETSRGEDDLFGLGPNWPETR